MSAPGRKPTIGSHGFAGAAGEPTTQARVPHRRSTLRARWMDPGSTEGAREMASPRCRYINCICARAEATRARSTPALGQEARAREDKSLVRNRKTLAGKRKTSGRKGKAFAPRTRRPPCPIGKALRATIKRLRATRRPSHAVPRTSACRDSDPRAQGFSGRARSSGLCAPEFFVGAQGSGSPRFGVFRLRARSGHSRTGLLRRCMGVR